jgi:hypothetical protein
MAFTAPRHPAGRDAKRASKNINVSKTWLEIRFHGDARLNAARTVTFFIIAVVAP